MSVEVRKEVRAENEDLGDCVVVGIRCMDQITKGLCGIREES